MEERELEIANRMKNLIWTVCGDYTLEAKPDVDGFCGPNILPCTTESSRERSPDILTRRR